jgi:hypothetical protein
LFAALLCCVTSSCINDPVDEPADSPTNVDEFHIAFTLTINSPSTSRADNTTWGDTYDQDNVTYDAAINPFDISVALFDTDGNLMGAVTRLNCYELEDGTYQYYGLVSKENFYDKSIKFEVGKKYRCMVVANTGVENVDFANIDKLTFKAESLPQGDNTNNFYVPMWGVHSFTFAKSGDTQSIGNIDMLRSAVKCRIHFSDELLEKSPELRLVDVKFNCLSPDGYVVPAGYNAVNETTALSYIDCYNPAPTVSQTAFELDENGEIKIDENGQPKEIDNTTRISLFSDANNNLETIPTDGTTSAMCYFAECSTAGTNVVNLNVTLHSNAGESEYTVPIEINGTNKLTRNHVYDLEITDVEHGLGVQMSSYWGFAFYRTEFTSNITYNGTPLTWVDDTYLSKDDATKTIILKSGVTLEAQIRIATPTDCTWVATLSALDSDDTTNAIEFESGSTATSISGTIDGVNIVTLKIKPATDNNSMQHKSKLSFYVQRADKTTIKADEVDGWTIVQNTK